MLFFFSSRRRHTRFDCDWSSDVCSSDLDGVNRLGAFDHIGSGPGAIEIPQGLFAGRGGVGGVLSGINGGVTNVTARQIAAIAAAVDANGLFAAASKIATVKAALIGFDLDMDGVFDST